MGSIDKGEKTCYNKIISKGKDYCGIIFIIHKVRLFIRTFNALKREG